MPYISASIIFQLLVQVVPSLKKVSEEGEAGRKKINQWTRYATVLLCFFQGPMMIKALSVSGVAIFPPTFGFGMFLLAGLLMTAGSLLLMWIGEQIDEYGIGNGVSLIIMANIMSRLPAAITELHSQFQFTLNPAEGQIGIIKVVFLLVLFVAVVFCIIYITQGQRRIPFQQAKQVRGQRVYGGMKHYLPIQVNAANVIPIIFAQSLLMFPMYGAQALMGATMPGGHWESSFFYGIAKAGDGLPRRRVERFHVRPHVPLRRADLLLLLLLDGDHLQPDGHGQEPPGTRIVHPRHPARPSDGGIPRARHDADHSSRRGVAGVDRRRPGNDDARPERALSSSRNSSAAPAS